MSFELGVLNEGDLGVTLDTLSELVITNGQIFYAAKLDEPTFINSGGVSTLSFQENIVPNDLLPGFYTPILNLSGLNEDNSILQQDNLLLDQNSVSIAGVEINDIICADNEVWPGKSDITLEVVFTNESVITLDNFNIIDLSFGNYSGDYEQLNTDISTSLSPGEVGSATFIVTVNEEASYGNVTLDANLSANANGVIYKEGSQNNHSWVVLSPANPSFLLNTFSPGFVANEQGYTFNLELSNDGNMELLVDTSTRLVIRDGSFELSSNLSTEILLERNDTSKTLSFDPIFIPNDFSTGVFSPMLILSGSMENDENFSDEIILQESLIIHPKILFNGISNTLDPDSIIQGQAVNFSMKC